LALKTSGLGLGLVLAGLGLETSGLGLGLGLVLPGLGLGLDTVGLVNITEFMYAFDNGLHEIKPAGHGNISKDAMKRGNRRLLKIGRGG